MHATKRVLLRSLVFTHDFIEPCCKAEIQLQASAL